MFQGVLINMAEGEHFFRGTVFRMQADYPYEETVDLMLILNDDSPSELSMIVSSGYKAGHIVCHLPKESKFGSNIGISKQWLIDNWANWIYPEVEDVSKILVSPHYTV